MISGSSTASALNRMPAALLKQSKVRFAVVFSPRHSPNKFGSALDLSKTFYHYSRSIAASALNSKSLLPRDGLTHVNIAVRRTARAAAFAPRRPAVVRECSHRALRRLLSENIPSINTRQPNPRPDHVLISSFFKMVKCGTTKIVYRADRG